VKAYVSSTSGAWDLFRAIDYTVSPLKFATSLSQEKRDYVHKVSSVMGASGIALSVPTAISDVISLKNSITDITKAKDTPNSDPERSKKVAQAYKRSVINGVDLGYTLCQTSSFLNDAQLVQLGNNLPIVRGVQQVTSLISDTNEIVEEAYKLHEYSKTDVRSEREKSLLEAKKNLSWLKIAKDIPCLAMSALALVGIFFTSIAALPIVSVIFLTLSVIWLSLKTSSYFYDKIVVESL
jgi:hypothetical protein